MAIPESLVATYIAKAHANGIKVIAASSIPEKISVENGHYDVSVWARHLDATADGGQHSVHQDHRWTLWKTPGESHAGGTVRS